MISLPIGTIVRYSPREGEPSYPAFVTRDWQDGTYQLWVMHFEQTPQNVRAALAAQLEPLINPDEISEILEEFATMGQRLQDVEGELEELRRVVQSIRPQPKRDTPPDAGEAAMPEIVPDAADVESTQPEKDEAEQGEGDGTKHTTAKSRRATWPR